MPDNVTIDDVNDEYQKNPLATFWERVENLINKDTTSDDESDDEED